MPRPQKRQTPTAVLRQCQQSMSEWPPSTRGSVFLYPVQGDHWIQRSLVERVPDHLVESIAAQPEGANGRDRPDGCRSRDVQEESDLPEVATRTHRPDGRTVVSHLDLSGADGIEGISFLPLLHDRLAGDYIDPIALLRQLHQLIRLQMGEAGHPLEIGDRLHRRSEPGGLQGVGEQLAEGALVDLEDIYVARCSDGGRPRSGLSPYALGEWLPSAERSEGPDLLAGVRILFDDPQDTLAYQIEGLWPLALADQWLPAREAPEPDPSGQLAEDILG